VASWTSNGCRIRWLSAASTTYGERRHGGTPAHRDRRQSRSDDQPMLRGPLRHTPADRRMARNTSPRSTTPSRRCPIPAGGWPRGPQMMERAREPLGGVRTSTWSAPSTPRHRARDLATIGCSPLSRGCRVRDRPDRPARFARKKTWRCTFNCRNYVKQNGSATGSPRRTWPLLAATGWWKPMVAWATGRISRAGKPAHRRRRRSRRHPR